MCICVYGCVTRLATCIPSGATQDTFVSLGHSDDVDDFVTDMVAILNKKKLRVWWDKGGARQRGGPRPPGATDRGMYPPWRSPIESSGDDGGECRKFLLVHTV